MSQEWPWAVALISSREAPGTLLASVQAVLDALRKPACVDVLVNGNAALAETMSELLRGAKTPAGIPVRLRLWHIPLGDKANAINAYVHEIAPACQAAYFVDGYARPHLRALELMAAELASHPTALAASAVPTEGRSAPALAQQMLSSGGLHGNLYAVSGSAMQTMRSQGFRLPTGLYRTDSTMGAALAFGLDPEHQDWDMFKHIRTVPTASWSVDVSALWQLSSLRTRWNRRLRQARGDLENWAIRYWFALCKRPLSSLPPTVQQLIRDWCQQDAQGVADRIRWHPLRRHALGRVLEVSPEPPPAQAQAPRCVCVLQWPESASTPLGAT